MRKRGRGPDGQAHADRRLFLRMAAAGAPAVAAFGLFGCGSAAVTDGEVTPISPGTPGVTPVLAPRVNGAVNIHPLRILGSSTSPNDATIVPELVALQVESVYASGFDGMRITAPFSDRGSFLAAIAYARATRAIGVDAVIVLTEFAGLGLPTALAKETTREAVLDLYGQTFVPPPAPVRPGLGGLGRGGVGRVGLQVLNEPLNFFGIPPVPYVEEFLAPTYHSLKARFPDAIVVSAAEVGTKAGAVRMRVMIEAGLERVTDRVAFHVYDRDVIPLLSPNVRSLVWITESGARGTSQHLPWVRDVFPDILAGVADASRIFFYDLHDPEPGGYRVLDFQQQAGQYVRVVESKELYAYWKGRVDAAAAGPVIPFANLIPDVRAYFPTADDVALYDATLEKVMG